MDTVTEQEIDPVVLDLLASPAIVSAFEESVAIERRIAEIRAEPLPKNEDPVPIKNRRGGMIYNLRGDQRRICQSLADRLQNAVVNIVREERSGRGDAS